MKKPAKKVIVLTGPSASGKSRAAAWLARRGWRHHDGDLIARRLYLPGTPGWRAIVGEFGRQFVTRSGRIDRKALGRAVFSSVVARRRLDAILFPRLIQSLRRLLRAPGKHCVDMPVYFNAGAPDFGGRVLLIDAPVSLRVRRLLKRGMDPRRARAQAKALKFGPAQRRRADEVIQNRGSVLELHRRLNHFLEKYDTSTR